jgi:hypothetical protein
MYNLKCIMLEDKWIVCFLIILQTKFTINSSFKAILKTFLNFKIYTSDLRKFNWMYEFYYTNKFSEWICVVVTILNKYVLYIKTNLATDTKIVVECEIRKNFKGSFERLKIYIVRKICETLNVFWRNFI